MWEWKERDVGLPVFTEKINVSNVWALKRKGARQTVKKIAFQFDIGVATKHKILTENGQNLNMKCGWLGTKKKCVRLSGE